MRLNPPESAAEIHVGSRILCSQSTSIATHGIKLASISHISSAVTLWKFGAMLLLLHPSALFIRLNYKQQFNPIYFILVLFSPCEYSILTPVCLNSSVPERVLLCFRFSTEVIVLPVLQLQYVDTSSRIGTAAGPGYRQYIHSRLWDR